MNAMSSAQAAKWTWATASMTMVLMSMVFVLTQQRRRRSIIQPLPGMAPANGTIAPRSQADVTIRRRTSQVSRHPLSPRRATSPRRKARAVVEPLPQSEAGSPAQAGAGKSPGLHLNRGLWNIFYVPYVSEAVSFLAGLVAILLTQLDHPYGAVGILVGVFFFRMKIMDTSFNHPPLLSDASKMQLVRSLDRETLHELLQDDLPRWVKFPDVEKCDWLNNTIETLWPYVKVAVARSVKDALRPALESLKAKLLMTELGFRGLDLGTAAPVINGVKSQKNLEEQVVIDVDLLNATQNSDVVLTFGNPGSRIHMNVEISDFLLRGTLRIVMKPLFPRWPTFGAISISFTEKPTINFHLKTMHVNLMELPALSSAFHNAIRSAVDNACVWPNKIVLPLVEDLSKLEIEALANNRPLGMLVIRNLRLNGLNPLYLSSRWTGMFQFHANLSVGKEKSSTEVVHGLTEQDFGDDAYHLLVLDPKTQDLSIALHYKEAFGKTHMIDSKWIHLDHLERHVPSDEFVAFGRDGVGRAEFELCWYPFSGLSKDQQRQSGEAPLPLDIASMGAVFIKLIRCERLSAMDMSGTSDPYVIFRVGARSKKSSIKGRSLNPVWDPPERFELIVTNERHDDLLATVMDYDYLKPDDEIGSVAIPLAQVQRSARLIETWTFENGGGSITLELEWKSF
ncbi:hypothetical protein Poli38472_005259 [Pythium oligandrum]|uniref:Uncharacterized protein n=1 Tax=Pythium oligandrum TaxID=41045 RepID=A0A8K1FHE8_PYTOL|nr:hypothetical protein Poli38472_005259 [Pythium oligandrum]|eukprot:TMW62641.1 hypothetical protein Poli38472_005259 [Pythium oligandrum]